MNIKNPRGAGRKPAPELLKKTPRSVKLPEWLWKWMDEQPGTNRAILIEEALCEKHNLKPPEKDFTHSEASPNRQILSQD